MESERDMPPLERFHPKAYLGNLPVRYTPRPGTPQCHPPVVLASDMNYLGLLLDVIDSRDEEDMQHDLASLNYAETWERIPGQREHMLLPARYSPENLAHNEPVSTEVLVVPEQVLPPPPTPPPPSHAPPSLGHGGSPMAMASTCRDLDVRRNLLEDLEKMVSLGFVQVKYASVDDAKFAGVNYHKRTQRQESNIWDPYAHKQVMVASYGKDEALLAARAHDKMKIKMYLCGVRYRENKVKVGPTLLNFPPEEYVDDLLLPEVVAIETDYDKYRKMLLAENRLHNAEARIRDKNSKLSTGHKV